MQQLKGSTGSTGMSQWAHNKAILRDQAVDDALAKAKTDMLYAKYLEEQHKKWKPQTITVGPRPTINDPNPNANNDNKNNDIDNDNINAPSTATTANTTVSSNAVNPNDDDYDSLDELEKDLDGANDKALAAIHAKRKAQLKKEWKKKQQQMALGGGRYDEMNERDMLKLATKGGNIVIHFYASGIDLGKIVDEHIRRIAPKHIEARFVTLDSRKSPFLVNKWKIRTLPTICCIVGGYLVDKIIGFDELGGKKDFPTIALVRRLAKSGVIDDPQGKIKKKAKRTKIITDLM